MRGLGFSYIDVIVDGQALRDGARKRHFISVLKLATESNTAGYGRQPHRQVGYLPRNVICGSIAFDGGAERHDDLFDALAFYAIMQRRDM